ncbi:hypothetical protein, partial [Aerosakkonema funiforme]|uniref:hypothetical protein n=1 Tax=Aerosakkonema funiforme TaxID=1246630 RepID=UPI0035B79664
LDASYARLHKRRQAQLRTKNKTNLITSNFGYIATARVRVLSDLWGKMFVHVTVDWDGGLRHGSLILG